MMRVAVAFFAALAAALAPGVAAARTHAPSQVLRWHVTLAPAPDDLALAELRVPASRRPVPTSRNVTLARRGSLGQDYLVVAAVRGPRGGGRAVLALAVDHSPLGATASGKTSLALQVPRTLGEPATAVFSDPFTSPTGVRSSGASLARCRLTRGGAALAPASLIAIDARGAALSGFSATEAVAAAYDAVCGLPFPSAFRAAVQPAGTPCAQGSVCCPPTATCVPTPMPPPEPVPVPPRCGPCEPRPGFACPLSPTPSVCYQPAELRTAAPAGAGAH